MIVSADEQGDRNQGEALGRVAQVGPAPGGGAVRAPGCRVSQTPAAAAVLISASILCKAPSQGEPGLGCVLSV